jgi:hypothetical protein
VTLVVVIFDRELKDRAGDPWKKPHHGAIGSSGRTIFVDAMTSPVNRKGSPGGKRSAGHAVTKFSCGC